MDSRFSVSLPAASRCAAQIESDCNAMSFETFNSCYRCCLWHRVFSPNPLMSFQSQQIPLEICQSHQLTASPLKHRLLELWTLGCLRACNKPPLYFTRCVWSREAFKCLSLEGKILLFTPIAYFSFDEAQSGS